MKTFKGINFIFYVNIKTTEKQFTLNTLGPTPCF